MMPEATDGQEAALAVARSKARLEAAKAREPAVKGLVARLAQHLERNHFSDRLDEAFGREHRTP
jgi:hypothetical protein